MSRQPERIVYSASWRDFIFAIFPGGSFSTATPDSVSLISQSDES
jgi:hypothetical protein